MRQFLPQKDKDLPPGVLLADLSRVPALCEECGAKLEGNEIRLGLCNECQQERDEEDRG